MWEIFSGRVILAVEIVQKLPPTGHIILKNHLIHLR